MLLEAVQVGVTASMETLDAISNAVKASNP